MDFLLHGINNAAGALTHTESCLLTFLLQLFFERWWLNLRQAGFLDCGVGRLPLE